MQTSGDRSGEGENGGGVGGATEGGERREKCPVPAWWRRLGAAAFLFFLIKGLLWLAVPALVAMGLFR